MHENIGRSLSAFHLEEAQSHANMALVPILWPKSGGPDYLTMKEALEKAVLVVTEVNEGGAVGFDCLSRDKAFAGLFPKLVKSYAMEAWLAARKKGEAKAAEGDKKGNAIKRATKKAGPDTVAAAKAFLGEAAACEEKIYDSVGLGKDFRYTGPKLVGSALAVDDAVIHTAFFRVTESEQAGKMAGMNRRRSFRI